MFKVGLLVFFLGFELGGVWSLYHCNIEAKKIIKVIFGSCRPGRALQGPVSLPMQISKAMCIPQTRSEWSYFDSLKL